MESELRYKKHTSVKPIRANIFCIKEIMCWANSCDKNISEAFRQRERRLVARFSLGREMRNINDPHHCLPTESKAIPQTHSFRCLWWVEKKTIAFDMRAGRRHSLNYYPISRETDDDDYYYYYYWWEIAHSRAGNMITTMITLLYVGVREREEKRWRRTFHWQSREMKWNGNRPNERRKTLNVRWLSVHTGESKTGKEKTDDKIIGWLLTRWVMNNNEVWTTGRWTNYRFFIIDDLRASFTILTRSPHDDSETYRKKH
jgi:hypothetical protein